MDIKWMPVVINGATTDYIVSEFSNVKNVKTGKMLTASKLQGSERERVHLHIDGKPMDFKIYRLSYEAFFGPIPPNMTLDHIDENIHNNHISNFRLLSPSDNIKSFLRNHPDHGFQKIYTDDVISALLKDMHNGMYYKDAANKHGVNQQYSYTLLQGLRRRDLWEINAPYPRSAHLKSYLSESDKEVAMACIIDGFSTRDILKFIEVEYDAKGIDAISKLRQKIGILDPKYFEQSFLNDVDALILSGKSNTEIYQILHIELDQRISDMMARRRKRLGIRNNNLKFNNADEMSIIRSMIASGSSNSEILQKIQKDKSNYYVNLFGRLRQEYKKSKQIDTQRLSKA